MSKIRLIFCLLNLALQIQFFLGDATKFVIRNNCSYTVWPAFSVSKPTSSLKNQETLVVDLPAGEYGRFGLWGRTGCDNSTGKFVCQTGDCGTGDIDCASAAIAVANRSLNVTTLVEFNDYFYDITLVNGYNVAISVEPRSETASVCTVTGCILDVSGACPEALKLGGACQSPCQVFNTPQYCCTATDGILCEPTEFSNMFKSACPRAHSYPMDYNTSTYTCDLRATHYVVTFCPSSGSMIRELSKPFQASPSPLSPLPSAQPPPPLTPSLPLPPSPSPLLSPQLGNTNYTGTNPRKSKRRRLPTSTLVAIPTAAAISILLLLKIWICVNKRKTMNRHHEEVDEIMTMGSVQFDINTIRTATCNFSIEHKLGEGGFGEVYKGKLESGQEVAVKRLLQNSRSRQGVVEFKTEVVLVAKLQHKNLVKLLGFCVTSEEKILVHEFLCNSSLDRFLFDPTGNVCLDWKTRFKILVGIARGLLYLHEDSRLTIIHRDLKTSNILLDRAMNPKISDFGLARLFGEDQTQGDTKKIVGTYGYMAPEYAITGHYSVKSDVYSFGVMMLEIISGQKNRFFGRLQLKEALLHRAWRLWNERKPLDLVDTTLNNDFPKEEVTRCFHIGLLCIQEDAARRPRVRSILDALERPSFILPEPNPPRFFNANTNPEDHHSSPYMYTGSEINTDLYPR